MTMLRITALLGAAALVLLATSCDTKNVGWEQGPHPPYIESYRISVITPPNMNGGADANWTVTWYSGTAPYTIAMAMGGGATADVPAGTAAESPYEHTFTMVNPRSENDFGRNDATYMYTVTVTGADGNFGVMTGTYTVGPVPNIAPSIDSITYIQPTLTVVASDQDSYWLEVSVTEPPGLIVDRSSKEAAQVSGDSAVFTWSAEDFFSGGTGETTITVDDYDGGTATATQMIAITPPVTPPPGELHAYALSSTASVGWEPVTIVVITGDLPADAPFNFCDGVGFTVNQGADYAAGSFNIGAVGGNADAPDGIWGDMSPLPIGYIMPQDWMMAWTALAGDPTMGRIDFNATAIGGSGITTVTDGAILNFGLEFSEPGVYDLGFQYFEDVRRTYYSGPDSTTYEWDNLDNDNDYNQIIVF